MNSADNFVANILVIINVYLVQLIFAVAFVVFFWGVFQYFIAGGADEEKRKKGKQFVMYGLIGFVIMISLWGIINILINTLGIGGGTRPDLPLFGGGSGGASTQTQNSTTFPPAPPPTGGGTPVCSPQCGSDATCVFNTAGNPVCQLNA
jgi:hypothetical protein